LSCTIFFTCISLLQWGWSGVIQWACIFFFQTLYDWPLLFFVISPASRTWRGLSQRLAKCPLSCRKDDDAQVYCDLCLPIPSIFPCPSIGKNYVLWFVLRHMFNFVNCDLCHHTYLICPCSSIEKNYLLWFVLINLELFYLFFVPIHSSDFSLCIQIFDMMILFLCI